MTLGEPVKKCRRGHSYTMSERLGSSRGCPICRRKQNNTTKTKREIREQAWKTDPKAVARFALRGAVRSGKIERMPCHACGATENIHGHHEDYSKPLEVIWLCQSHHLELHQSRASGQRSNP